MTDDPAERSEYVSPSVIYKATMERAKTGREFVREVGADLDKWTDEMFVSAKNNGHPVEREWLRSWLCDAMQAAQKAMPKTFVTEEPDGDTT